MRSYEAARSLFSFLGFIAWSVVVIGALVAVISAAGVSQYAGGGAGLLAMVPGIAIGITGFILVAFVQMGRATVGTAEYTQQMLKIARDQLDVSRQGLNQGKALEQGFAALRQPPEEKSAASFADATSDLAPEMASVTVADTQPILEEFFHKGEHVRLKGKVLIFGGETFTTEIDARRYIDDLEARRITLSKPQKTGQAVKTELDRSEAPPQPSLARIAAGLEDGELNYGGKKIQVKSGKFLTATMAFSSYEAVQKYLDQLGVNPNATLGGVRR